MSRSLAVVILHYGDPGLTERIHAQLARSDPDLRERVFVLDNAAPEPYGDAWLRSGENLYWGGALAFCAQEFGERGYSHLWFLNNDIYFASKPPHLSRAWGRLKRLEAAVGRIGVYSPAALQNPYHPQMVADPRFQYRRAQLADGIAPLLNLECVREVGGVDCEDNVLGYGVEMWLSLRASRAGWGVVVDHQVTLRHSYHSTAKRVDGFLARAGEAERRYLAARMGEEYAGEIDRLRADFKDFETL